MKLSAHISRATVVALLAASAGAGVLLALTAHRESEAVEAAEPPTGVVPGSFRSSAAQAPAAEAEVPHRDPACSGDRKLALDHSAAGAPCDDLSHCRKDLCTVRSTVNAGPRAPHGSTGPADPLVAG
jgi:hypothetical protein